MVHLYSQMEYESKLTKQINRRCAPHHLEALQKLAQRSKKSVSLSLRLLIEYADKNKIRV